MRIPFRGVVVFLLVWAILWLVPAFRGQIVRGFQPQNPEPWSSSLSEEEIADGLKANPNDSFLRSRQLQVVNWKNSPREITQFFRSYDALIAQHPADVGLRRNRLRLSTTGNIVPQKYAEGIEGAVSGKWLTPNELQGVVTQARLAQKVEPNEAFFPWIEAMALWGLGREEESVAALERAGQCTSFNDGSLDEARLKLASLSRIHPLEWDEKIGVLWSALLPHFAGMRGLTREITYSGVARYRAGDKSEAWRRWEIVSKAGRTLRLSQRQGKSSGWIGLLVGEAIEQIPWGLVAEEVEGFKPQQSQVRGLARPQVEERRTERLVLFVRAANRDGRQQFAQWAERENAEITARRTEPGAESVASDIYRKLGWTSPWARVVVQLRWIGMHTVLWALVGVAGWILAMLVSRGGGHSRVATSTVVMLSVFFGTLWLGLTVLAAADGSGNQSFAQVLSLAATNETSGRASWLIDWDGSFWWAIGATFVAAALGRELGAWRQKDAANTDQNRIRTRSINAWKWGGIALWLAALVISLMLWFDGKNNFELGGQAPILAVAWVACLVLGIVIALKTPAIPSERRQSILVAINAAMSLAVFVLSGKAYQSDAAAWTCLVMLLLSAGLWVWTGRRGLWSLSHLTANLEVGGRVMSNIALILSVGYLVVSAALLPTRAQLNARADEYIQMGEMDWLRTPTK